MKIIENYLTKNDVYENNQKRIDSRYRKFQDGGPKGAMLHSVGTPQPDADVFIRNWNKPGVEKAVHAFIEPDAVHQTLPWHYRGWHAGGTANNTHIGVEMTEPSTIKYTGGSSWTDLDPVATEEHVRATYANAVELFAILCLAHGWDPLGDGVILSHAEGHKRGVASNHGDPEHIWKKFGLSMDSFRAAVAARLHEMQMPAREYRVQAGPFTDAEEAKALARRMVESGFQVAVLDVNGAEVPLYRIGVVSVSSSLNIRSGPGASYSRVGKLKNGDEVAIINEQKGWGELQQGGWVSLDYVK